MRSHALFGKRSHWCQSLIYLSTRTTMQGVRPLYPYQYLFFFSLQCSTFIFSFWSLCCCYNCNYVIVIMMCKSIDGCMSYPPDKTTSPTLDSIFIGPDESHKSRWLNSNGRHLPRISSVCQLIKRNFYGLK